MAGRQKQILDERDRRLEAAREQRAKRRALLRAAASAPPYPAQRRPQASLPNPPFPETQPVCLALNQYTGKPAHMQSYGMR